MADSINQDMIDSLGATGLLNQTDINNINNALAQAQGRFQVNVTTAAILMERNNQTSTCFLSKPGLLAILPIPMQNESSWATVGCLPGFYCPNNNAANLPEFCTPTPNCAARRLGGIQCGAQGRFEPTLCRAGFYCPVKDGISQEIECPVGHFCPKGSWAPLKCSVGARCPAKSQRDMGFIPVGVLIIIDVILIGICIYLKLYSFYTSRVKKGKKVLQRAATIVSRGAHMPAFRGNNYERLDDEQYHGQISPGESMIPMSERGSTMAEYVTENDESDRTDLQQFVQSLSKIMGDTKFGLTFEFQNLRFHPKKAPRPILQDVSGCINAGSLWGVMGASGAGKSTFVNVLMGKQSGITGVTKVNGVSGDIKKYKKIIGYVPQDDIVLPELTVRENILHSARIRLPSSWSDNEIQHHVDVLLSCLQLSHVKDSLVGSPGAPVISGGQRKRVSIGMELAAAPMALFLDEPTSGLDATAAASIMSTLKALSRLGMTIIVVIHQPRPEIFESLDSLVLLGSGRMIYQGPEDNIQSYLENLGFTFPLHSNPADIMGDIIAGEGRLYKPTGDHSVQWLIDHWASQHPAHHSKDDKRSTITTSEITSLTKTIKQRGAPFHRQTILCFKRSLLQQFRMKSSFFFELGVGAMAGFLIGLSQIASEGDNFTGVFIPPYTPISSAINYSKIPQIALLVGLSIGLTASAPGVKVFGEEKLVYWREAAAGHNRFAYYIGKVLSTIPRMVLANFHFTTLFMLLSTPRMEYMQSFAANLVYFWCVYGIASCISMVTRREDGPLLAVMCSLIVGVLNGTSPTLDNVREWNLAWLWRSSPGTWLAEAYFTENLTPLGTIYLIEDARERLGYRLGSYAKDCLMLLALGAIYRVLGFLLLRFMYPSKQR